MSTRVKLAVLRHGTIAYDLTGRGDPVVFIHGALIADTFRPLQAEPSVADRYRLIRYHRRGYADSDHGSGSSSLDEQASDCQALLRHLGIARTHVVGHSYGGAIALQLALNFPELVHSLTLLEAAVFAGAAAQGYQEALLREQVRFRQKGPAVAVHEFLLPRFGADYEVWLERAIPGAVAQTRADADTWFEHEIPGLIRWRFGEAEAASITQPTLVVLGAESDALWSRFGETYRWLLRALPHARGFVLPAATHGLQIQNPGAAAEALAAFFAKHPFPT